MILPIVIKHAKGEIYMASIPNWGLADSFSFSEGTMQEVLLNKSPWFTIGAILDGREFFTFKRSESCDKSHAMKATRFLERHAAIAIIHPKSLLTVKHCKMMDILPYYDFDCKAG